MTEPVDVEIVLTVYNEERVLRSTVVADRPGLWRMGARDLRRVQPAQVRTS